MYKNDHPVSVRQFSIKDTNPETRKLYDWFTNPKNCVPLIRKEIRELFEHSMHEAAKHKGNQEEYAIFYLTQKISIYAQKNLALRMHEEIEEAKQSGVSHDEMEYDYIVADLFERALRNVSYATLGQAVYNYYSHEKN
jgi:hypothetical protein